MEINSTENMETKVVKQHIGWQHLNAMRFGDGYPFTLKFMDEQLFEGQEVLRLIPRKRLVVKGLWLNKPVVAKLFFDPQHAKRHFDNELAGYHLLHANKIPTPPLYYQGISEDRRIHVLIFEYIADAEDLETLWLRQPHFDAALPLLQAIILEIATQHVLGVLQHDLHLKNFLVTHKTIFTLDPAQVEKHPPILTRKLSLKNIALFTCQLGVLDKQSQEKLFRYYGECRGWVIKQEDIFEFFAWIKKYNNTRWQQYVKKIFRNSTQFVSFNHLLSRAVVDRAYQNNFMQDFLKDPESVFELPNTEFLKRGRSATVIKVSLADHTYVVKRYNLKNLSHRLRRCLRHTRAYCNWRFAHKLQLFGVKTAKPIAFLEKKCLGFRGRSYYVSEFINGEDARHFLCDPAQAHLRSQVITAIAGLLKKIAMLELTHGDLKITNILIDENYQPALIDLDGTVEHFSLSSLRAAWVKEIKRFLENFKDDPELLTQFNKELFHAGNS